MTEMQQQLATSCRRFGVSSLYVFGSHARDLAARCFGEGGGPSVDPSADVDIAVQPARGALCRARDRVLLASELESLLGAGRVDLVILPEASAFVAANAIRGELLYCEDEDQQSREELYYLRRAADLAPFQQERLQLLLTGELRR